MLAQKEKIMAMLITAGLNPTNGKKGNCNGDGGANGGGGSSGGSTSGGGANQRGTPGKVVAAWKCGVCGKDSVRHLVADCWEDDRNADKRPKWHPKYKGDN